MKLKFSRQFFEKYSNIKFNENPSSGSLAIPCGRTDGRTDMKLIVAFLNFAKVLKKNTVHHYVAASTVISLCIII